MNNMANNEEKPDMKRYDYLGLVGQLGEQDKIYTFGAMEAFGDQLSEGDLREAYINQLRSPNKGSGLEHLLEVYSPIREDNRNRTTLRDFCNIYGVDESTRKVLAKYFEETIGSIEAKIKNEDYI